MTDKIHIAALEDLRAGVQMDRHNLPDSDAKLAALDAALAVLRAAGGPVAVLRYERGTPGRENEMPRVVSCNRLPDGDYPVYAAPQASAEESAIDKPIPDSVEHYGLIDERVGAPAAEASAKGAGDVWQAFSTWVTTKASDETYVLSAKDGFYAGVEWCRQQRGGDVDERAAFERRFRIEPENWSTAGGGGYRNVWYEARWEGWKARAALAAQPAASAEPSDEEIDAIAASMPDGAGGMLKQWGYRQFARALLSSYGRPAGDAQPVAAQETYPQMMPAELSQFLSDVMTAAGLVSHGKQCKALGERLGDACMRLRLHYPEPFAAPVATQKADDARDAERYRWLKDLLDNEEVTAGLHEAFMAGPEAMDAALDAAIAQQRKGE